MRSSCSPPFSCLDNGFPRAIFGRLSVPGSGLDEEIALLAIFSGSEELTGNSATGVYDSVACLFIL